MTYILFDATAGGRPVTEFTPSGNVGTDLGRRLPAPTEPLVFDSISELIHVLRAQPAVGGTEWGHQNHLTIRRATEITTVTFDEEVS